MAHCTGARFAPVDLLLTCCTLSVVTLWSAKVFISMWASSWGKVLPPAPLAIDIIPLIGARGPVPHNGDTLMPLNRSPEVSCKVFT